MKELNQSIFNLWNLYKQYRETEQEAQSQIIITAIGYLIAVRDLLYRTDIKTC